VIDIKLVDRLIQQAKEQKDPKGLKALDVNNPYIGKSFEELLDYLDGNDYRAPEKPSFEWDQFMWALIGAPKDGSRDLIE